MYYLDADGEWSGWGEVGGGRLSCLKAAAVSPLMWGLMCLMSRRATSRNCWVRVRPASLLCASGSARAGARQHQMEVRDAQEEAEDAEKGTSWPQVAPVGRGGRAGSREGRRLVDCLFGAPPGNWRSEEI
jgi:hypothetical protein